MKFNYGDILRIRNELYTILGKIRYIDTHMRIWYKYKLSFGSVGMKSMMYISLQSYVAK